MIAKRTLIIPKQNLSWREKYPRFILLLCSFMFAFLLLWGRNLAPIQSVLSSLGYVGIFFAGLLYAYSFTAVPATAILLLFARSENLYLAGLVAGIGALVGDFIFFKLMRGSFSEELHRLAREKVIINIGKRFHHFKRYALMILASIIIASPLPTELGVAMFSSLKEMTTKRFLIVAYLLHTFGIFIILLIGKTL